MQRMLSGLIFLIPLMLLILLTLKLDTFEFHDTMQSPALCVPADPLLSPTPFRLLGDLVLYTPFQVLLLPAPPLVPSPAPLRYPSWVVSWLSIPSVDPSLPDLFTLSSGPWTTKSQGSQSTSSSMCLFKLNPGFYSPV